MLISLFVKNFAIIDNIEIDFKNQMTVLTGETGAGKSLIIDAIGLLFGKRSSSEWVRFGETKATIEGVFSSTNPKVKDIIGEIDDELLIIRREIYNNGKSICKVNNTTITLSQLAEISETIGDIHSQFDTHGLFNQKNYLDFIDDGDIASLLMDYQASLKEYNDFNRNYQKLLKRSDDDTQRLDFLKYQIAEIAKANLSVVEEEELKQRSNYLMNFENISQSIQEIIAIYRDNNLLDNIYESINILSKIEKYDNKYLQFKSQIEEYYYNLSDTVDDIFHEFKKFDFDPLELVRINDKLGIYSDFKRKYKKTIPEILEYYQEIVAEVNNIENYDLILFELEKDVKKSYNKTFEIAKNIRAKRMVIAKKLEKDLKENLIDLQLPNTQFQIVFNDVHDVSLKNNGIDEIDFYITFNKGEPLRPLAKVASGGELSRFMLALKTLVVEKLNLQTIIFDEIDNGVSGAIAYSIANKIMKISEKAQVLCVTHLPQVAAIANHHLKISKITDEDRTSTKIEELEYHDRIIEIAKMISNGEVTEASKNLAIELLKK